MRQFFTLGFWMSLLALAGLTFGLLAWTGGDESPVDAVVAPTDERERAVDLIAMVFAAQADPGAAIVGGRTTGHIQIRVDGFRFMEIPAGTEGENRCAALAELARCAIAVDLLGEAVLWFSIVPLSPRNLVDLPAPVGFREGDELVLANGWVVPHAERVERECEEDTSSLSDFMEQFGDRATSVFSLDEQQVIRAVCDPDAATPEVSAPEVTAPEVTGPEVTGPELTTPAAPGPGDSLPTAPATVPAGAPVVTPDPTAAPVP